MIDTWLWTYSRAREYARQQRLKNPEKIRERQRLVMRRWRTNRKEEKKNHLIRTVYNYEVHYGPRPIRQYYL